MAEHKPGNVGRFIYQSHLGEQHQIQADMKQGCSSKQSAEFLFEYSFQLEWHLAANYPAHAANGNTHQSLSNQRQFNQHH
ncbi:MAG: hypothetical protein LPH21_17065 [Shewanella sp.]|nr:hypothetical protein [Shewanella sp.]MCF1431487.1 hypothetical protein [Shewanella sp.]MCF1459185.1 hypothetical protein [Shewanella sp.]